MNKHSLVCLVFSLSLAPALAEELPAPVDTPEGPREVEAPGGRGLPPMGGAAGEGVPAISAISDVTFPDETLVVAGDNLAGARLRVWAEGVTQDVEPLRTANDRMLAIVPKTMPVSTMLVWPVRGERAGAPIRVNGATAWWSWPPRVAAGATGQTIRVIGKNLKLDGAGPRVWLSGPGASGAVAANAGQWLKVVSANPYNVEAALPDNLAAGACQVWAHNGTGGRYGWSEAMAFDVVSAPSTTDFKAFPVKDYGAIPNDGKDDWKAIAAAVEAAAKAGGGIVAFAAGEYHLSQAVVFPKNAEKGIHLIGAGMGVHDPQTHRLSGTFTALLPLEGAPLPAELIQIDARHSSLADITLLNGADGKRQRCASVQAHDASVERTRFIIIDRLPQVPAGQRKGLSIDNGALYLDAPGKSNIIVRACKFHTPGAGIQIGPAFQITKPATYQFPTTDYTRIADCVFRGYFTGVYKPLGKKGKGPEFIGPHESGYRSSGVINDSGAKYTIVERCDFAGADRTHGKVMGRSIQCHNSAVRGQYWADNNCHDVGNHPSLGEINRNMGEQLMFHYAYMGGGLFDVAGAEANSVSVDPSDPKYAGPPPKPSAVTFDLKGSVVPEDVDKNDHWVVFVCAGKGAGQYRVATGVRRAPRRVTFSLDRPWRVIPDATSRIVLQVVYRQNIVYHNLVDTGQLEKAHKSHGVIFWYNAIENIVAGNTFRNLTAGVVFNHNFRNPTAWNLTRDNVMENIQGYTGDTSIGAAFYVNHYRPQGPGPAPENRVWYSVGDIERSDKGVAAEAAAYLHTRFTGKKGKREYPPHPEGGIVMSVIENCRFERVGEGIHVSSPANWSLIRNNEVTTTDPVKPAVFDETSNAAADPKFYLRAE